MPECRRSCSTGAHRRGFRARDPCRRDAACADTGSYNVSGDELPENESGTPDPGQCPADTTGDGILDNGDIGAFVTLFLAGSPSADFTGDGILDNGDIGAFVAAFLAGC